MWSDLAPVATVPAARRTPKPSAENGFVRAFGIPPVKHPSRNSNNCLGGDHSRPTPKGAESRRGRRQQSRADRSPLGDKTGPISQRHRISISMADYWMDGTSYIVYDDGVDEWSDTCGEYCQGVGLATCTAGACSTTQIATINVYATIGAVVSIGADGNPAVVYEDSGFGYEGLPNLVHYYTNESDVVVASNACAAGVRG